MKRLLVIVLSVTIGCLAIAQSGHVVTYTVQPESQLWLEGTATLGSYTCRTAAISGRAGVMIDEGNEGSVRASHDSSAGSVSVGVQVHFLDCGNSAMNRDMYAALKAIRYPAITYTLVDARAERDTVLPGLRIILRTRGWLTIAGVTKEIEMVVHVVRLDSGRYQITGKKQLSMKDFGIDPPTAFWGIVKAGERLTVCFNLIAAPESQKFAGSSVTPQGAE